MPDSLPDSLPSSETHRLCYFAGAPESHKHIVVPNFVADEVEELRDFVKFLYPRRGQDRFKLYRPDILDPLWSVLVRREDGAFRTFAKGDTALQAVRNARARLLSASESGDLALTFD